MTDDRTRSARTPWFIWLSWMVAAISSPFLISAKWGEGTLDPAFLGYWETFFWFLPLGTVGAIIAHRQPRNAVGWLMLLVWTGWSFDGLNIASLDVAGAPGHSWRLWLETWFAQIPLCSLFILLPFIFPTGDAPSRRWRLMLWFDICVTFLVMGGFGFAPSVMSDPAMPAAIKQSVFETIGQILNPIVLLLIIIGVLLAVASVVWRFRHARYVERQQLKWFLFVVVIAGPLVVVSFVVSIAWMAALVIIAAGLPVAIMIAILRYDLFDIDRLINRTLVYGSLTAALLATYFALVLGLETLVQEGTGKSSPAVVAVSTLVVAGLFRPARGRIQALVDRRFYRQKYDAARTLEAFSARLRDEIDLETLAAELQGVMNRTMQPATVGLWLRQPDRNVEGGSAT